MNFSPVTIKVIKNMTVDACIRVYLKMRILQSAHMRVYIQSWAVLKYFYTPIVKFST